VLRGETRIDSFNNIVGISDVREAEWKDFEAHNLECGYGAKVALWDGELKGGIGFRDYLGRTEDEPGGKHISIEGAGMLLEYESDQLNTKLEWQRGIHDYTNRHQASFGNYDSMIDVAENTTDVTGRYKRLYLRGTYTSGYRRDVYTTVLFPENSFDYEHTDVALGINLQSESDGLTLIAPIFGAGSYRGSFNPVFSDDALKGIDLAGRLRGYNISMRYLRHEGVGNRPYLPATERLTERLAEKNLSIKIGREDWKLTLENARTLHTANAAIGAPIYAAILGGFGPYNNSRDEDKWTVSFAMPVSKKVTADISLYHTSRQDRQYNHPDHNYSEKGGFLHFKIKV
jgi:hypothetical protein